jgi:hypothetical protein
MTLFLDNPDPYKVKIYGPLGWISEEDRKHYLNLPAGEFKPQIKKLERALNEHKKKLKQREEAKKSAANTRQYLDALKD